ncbi:hypothetical protein SEVIR_2G370750v4 [Setaria viridis]
MASESPSPSSLSHTDSPHCCYRRGQDGHKLGPAPCYGRLRIPDSGPRSGAPTSVRNCRSVSLSARDVSTPPPTRQCAPVSGLVVSLAATDRGQPVNPVVPNSASFSAPDEKYQSI